MVSTRRSGSLSSNTNNNSTSSTSNTNNNSNTSNGNGNGNGKRSSSPSNDKPPSPKRIKVENGGAAEKSARISENSKEMCASPPSDPVDCLPMDAAPPAEGGAKAVNSAKADCAAALAAVPVSSPIPEGNSPAVMEQTRNWFSPMRNYQKQSLNIETSPPPWCRLLSQYSQNHNINISGSQFTVGSHRHCNFTLQDQTVSGVLCKIRHTQREGCVIAVLESTGSKGTVVVNGMAVKKNTNRPLHSGDEVVFGMVGSHAYIFQQLVMDVTVKAPLSVGNAEVHGAVGKYLPAEKRSGDPSAVAGASILASLSNLRSDITRWRTSGLSTPKTHQDSELSTHAVIQDGSEVELDGMEGNSTPNVECDNATDLGVTSKNIPLDCNPDCGDAGNVLEERNEVTRSSQPASTSGMSVRCAAFKEDIHAGVLDGNAVEVSFDDFPYYLSENTKNVLIAASYIHLKHREHAKYAAELPTVNPRILLSGPAGSEIYQEMLAKALAKYFGAKLLIFDSHAFLGGLSARESELLKDGRNAEKSSTGSAEMDNSTSPAGEADAPSTSNLHPSNGLDAQLKLEATPFSFSSSKNHSFKSGDRVRFIGSPSSAIYAAASPLRGPAFGMRGKVVLPFEDNPLSKIGVRFDKPIPGGVDLGNLCEVDHGFFCNVNDIRLENPGMEDLDKLLINTLFEAIFKESRSCPFILFIKDAEKSIVGNSESYSTFKNRLEKLPDNVVVIGSHTQTDNRKEKSHPGGLLFTKFGSNQTALLDLAFPDSFGRLHDKGKDTPRATKLLTKLFPNKVTIHMPQDEALLTSWKNQLERDAETLKIKSNLSHLRTVLSRSGLECEGLETLCIKDQTLSNESAEKVVGWALSNHLMHNAKSDSDSRIVLSAESIKYGMSILQAIQNESKSLKKSLKDVVTENEFEKRLLGDVIPPSDIGVTFDDIGALENVKDTLKELVMLPLQRPELFCKGQLTKPCKGILLFGPPGTGKTMLAKAVATEAGANFINISMSSITSKWFGEGEKYVKAVFSLASKIAPSVVFVDEVDSMLGRRENPGEHEARKIQTPPQNRGNKNEKKMKGLNLPPWEHLKAPSLIKIMAFSFLSLSLFFLGHHFSSFSSPFSLTFFNSPITSDQFHSVSLSTNSLNPPSLHLPPQTPPRAQPVLERMGIVDENGVMADDFKVGNFDPKVAEEVFDNMTRREEEKEMKKEGETRVRVKRYKVCGEKMREYIPCLDNVDAICRLNYTDKGEKFERHCPEKGKGLDCLVPAPKGYRSPIPWPQSRDEVWFSNIPHTRLVEDKGGQNWISIKGDKFVFPGGGTQFIHGADRYLDQISQMILDIKFGQNTRVALDIGCGVASFGAFLLQRNVTTLSVAPKDVHENQIQFALERGVPAMVSVFATRRLLYPSQGFDLIHCSRCRINWTRDDGILLLEVNRMLRAGGYFAWAAQPVYKHEDILQEQWKEMENLTSSICWELVKKEGYIAIWRKPMNNSCYFNREAGAGPPLCDPNDDPDNVWYVDLKACITKIPDNGYGGNVSTWPERLHNPPDRLQTIQMDAYLSRKEILKAESKYWKEIIQSYINAFRWKKLKIRNVMDMRAGFGGFAAALLNLQFDCWVMNVVPVSGFNTLPVIYDRGLIGVMHDWCEPFDTYPRTYDLLHSAGLFSVEKKRCDISTIMLEMDRMLRPGGIVYVRDSISVMEELQEVASAMKWVCSLHDTSEGPHASWKILKCDKRNR